LQIGHTFLKCAAVYLMACHEKAQAAVGGLVISHLKCALLYFRYTQPLALLPRETRVPGGDAAPRVETPETGLPLFCYAVSSPKCNSAA
jgi:hypothetical protein